MAFSFVGFTESRSTQDHQIEQQDKLLIVVIDGLRWDHLDVFTRRTGRIFPGFKNFQDGGVKTEYLKSVFPSESFPSWQSISTGRYPENHGIIGKVFYDARRQGRGRQGRGREFFNHIDERKTNYQGWWSRVQPLWATATMQGLKFANILFARCDEWSDIRTIRPHKCESIYQKDNSRILSHNMEMALLQFQTENVNAAIVYEEGLGKACEDWGPLSTQAERKLRRLDIHIKTFLTRLREANMEPYVNVVIISDHGMTYGSQPIPGNHPNNFPFNDYNIKQVQLGPALDRVRNKVKMVVGSGAYSMVYPKKDIDAMEVAGALKTSMSRYNGDVQVYMKEDIPEHLHWKSDSNTPPILVLATNGTVILRAPSNLQRPGKVSSWQGDLAGLRERTKQGISGYDPEERDMRGVFMARGPAFVSTPVAQPPIEVVDLYNMFCFILGIKPAGNDGIWERIKGLLRNGAMLTTANAGMIISLALISQILR